MRRGFTCLITFIVSIGLILTGCSGYLVSKSVQSALQGRKDTAAELERPDAISVVLCGTGGPMPSNRAQACTAVFVGG